MANNPDNLGSGQVGTTATSLASSDAGTKTILRRVVFYNTSSTTAIEVTVYRVPSGGTAGDAGTFLAKKTIPYGKSWVCIEAEGQTLAESQSLEAIAGSASTIDYNISGTQVT